jgi:asparagine synthase (glutamine-hydrolysing)
MADSIVHRGPDDEGYYRSGPVGLGFRRLAIIDLNTGHQPISNEDGSVWIVFNGEIYNYLELRDYLQQKGHTFRSKTDTEVIVHLYEEFGTSCVEKLRGMFAFAIWDNRKRTLLLARDRVGIKPLYYRVTDHSIVFGSEIKAILAESDDEAEVDPQVIDRFLTFYYVPGEDTLFRGVKKLAPGTCLTVTDGNVKINKYWDLVFSAEKSGLAESKEKLLALLEETVDLHMLSDVPVGVLLSGGLDSTALLGFASRTAEQKLSSYTVGFSDSSVTDERAYAREAAAYYGTEHHELTFGPKEFADFMPLFVRHMEEPVCEPPAVALYYVSKLASQFVKVLISGEGGDEAFAGYPNYRSMLWLEKIKKLGRPAVDALSVAMAAGGKRTRKFVPLVRTDLQSYYYSRSATPFTYFNQSYGRLYSDNFQETVNKQDSISPLLPLWQGQGNPGTLNKMLYIDTKTWLPDDLLIKADKITMANSVELRVPLLDHKMLEFAASLPPNFKVRGIATKYIAKSALRQHVPESIIKRRKAGFPVPYAAWLQGPLRDWLSGLLLDREAQTRKYFNRNEVERLITRHVLSGTHPKEVFSLAILELWHQQFLGARSRKEVVISCASPTS